MKVKIKSTLQNLFYQNHELVKGFSFKDIIDKLIEGNQEAYNLDTNSMGNLYDTDDIEFLQNSRENKQLGKLFESAKEGLNANSRVLGALKKDILSSIDVIRSQVLTDNKGFKNQIIFLEHDYEPNACFCGFGEGEYPILESPSYVKYNYQHELYNGVGSINYAELWKNKIELQYLLDEMDLSDQIWNSDIYQCLQNAYQFKTNLLLYEAFEQIPIEDFEDIPIKLPLFIFGNEHDCEAMNIYVYE